MKRDGWTANGSVRGGRREVSIGVLNGSRSLTVPKTSAAAERDERSVMAVERACDVLVIICANSGPMGIKEVSEALQLSGSTVHRLLAALLKKGLVEQHPETRKYAMGRRLLDVTLDRMRQVELPVTAMAHMHRLRNATKETVALSAVDGWTQTFLSQVESMQEIRQKIEIGKQLPLHAGGSGKATLAFFPDADREAYFAQTKLTAQTGGPLNLKRLKAELADIRQRGYARSVSERVPGAAAVAAPIFNHLGEVVGCLSVSGPAWRFTEGKFAEFGRQVMQAAGLVSRDLGAPASVEAGKSTPRKRR